MQQALAHAFIAFITTRPIPCACIPADLSYFCIFNTDNQSQGSRMRLSGKTALVTGSSSAVCRVRANHDRLKLVSAGSTPGKGGVPKWLRERSAKPRCSGSNPLAASNKAMCGFVEPSGALRRFPVHALYLSFGHNAGLSKACQFMRLPRCERDGACR